MITATFPGAPVREFGLTLGGLRLGSQLATCKWSKNLKRGAVGCHIGLRRSLLCEFLHGHASDSFLCVPSEMMVTILVLVFVEMPVPI